MGYLETINCPHCHEGIELEVDIEGSGDDAYASINPIELTKCLRCEEPISKEASELNDGLCDRCWKKQEFLNGIAADRLSGIL